MTITSEQRQAIDQAGDSPVELNDPQTGAAYYLMRAEVFLKLLEDKADQRDHEAWSQLARKARDQWATENPY